MNACDYRLYLVTDSPAAYPQGLLAGVEAAVAGGVTVVQYRPTTGPKRVWYEEGRALHAFLRARGIPLVINDHLDLALALEAEGLHVGQQDLPVEVARRLLGPTRLLGLSLTDPAQVHAVPPGCVDYFGVGPIFPTATKVDAAPALGLEGLRALRPLTTLPLVAIGGINETTTPAVLAAGADGVAVVSALSQTPDPAAAAQRFRALLEIPRP